VDEVLTCDTLGEKDQGPGLQDHPSAAFQSSLKQHAGHEESADNDATLSKQERILRIVFDKVKEFGGRTPHGTPPPSSCKPNDPELARIKERIDRTCCLPNPGELTKFDLHSS
jgi:hypothetical protein